MKPETPEIIVPIEALYYYANRNDWKPYCAFMKSRLANYGGKKINYKKAVKLIKKAAALLPLELVLELQIDLGAIENGK